MDALIESDRVYEVRSYVQVQGGGFGVDLYDCLGTYWAHYGVQTVGRWTTRERALAEAQALVTQFGATLKISD